MVFRYGRRLLSSLWAAVEGWSNDGCGVYSAALAYYAAFSLFPVILVLTSALGYVSRLSPGFQNLQQQLLETVSTNASPWLAMQIESLLSGIKDQANIGGPIGLITLMIGALGMFIQLDAIFYRIWTGCAPEQKSIWAIAGDLLYGRGMAFLMLIGLGLLVVVAFVINLTLTAVRSYIPDWSFTPYIWAGVQSAVNLVLNWIIFTLIFKVVPRARVPWRNAAGGGLLTAISWVVGLRVLESLVISDSYGAYGVIGSFLAIMVWMYYASAVLFLGAEFVYVGSRRPRMQVE